MNKQTNYTLGDAMMTKLLLSLSFFIHHSISETHTCKHSNYLPEIKTNVMLAGMKGGLI